MAPPRRPRDGSPQALLRPARPVELRREQRKPAEHDEQTGTGHPRQREHPAHGEQADAEHEPTQSDGVTEHPARILSAARTRNQRRGGFVAGRGGRV